MNDRNEIAQLRLLDAFLENGETDRQDWRDEVGAALDRARTSRSYGLEPMQQYGGSSSVASVEDADILDRLEVMMDGEACNEMPFVRVDTYSDDWENLMGYPIEIGWMVTDRRK